MRTVLLSLMLLACSGQEPTTADPVERPDQVAPDVLFVVLDTVRADASSAYGAARKTTPMLELLASQGVRWADATSPGSWTWPAHASLFTGLHPWEHGAHFAAEGDPAARTFGGDAYSLTGIHPQLPTLAETFAGAGYQTVALSANPLLTEASGMMRGFDEVRHIPEDAEVVSTAQALLASERDLPLLLFVNLYGAHAPFDVQPVDWLGRSEALDLTSLPADLRPWVFREGRRINFFRAPEDPADGTSVGVFGYARGEYPLSEEARKVIWDVYQGELTRVDFELSRLAQAWEQHARPRSIVAVTSDHGEHLGEHGLMDHGRAVSPEVLGVPLVVAAPGRLEPGVVEVPVSTRGLTRTLLDLAEVSGGPQTPALPLPGEAVPEEPVLAAAWADAFWASRLGPDFAVGERWVRQGDRALSQRGEQTPREWLRGADGRWTRNSPEHLDTSLMEALPYGIFAESGGAVPELSEETQQTLQALGYLEPETPEE